MCDASPSDRDDPLVDGEDETTDDGVSSESGDDNLASEASGEDSSDDVGSSHDEGSSDDEEPQFGRAGRNFICHAAF